MEYIFLIYEPQKIKLNLLNVSTVKLLSSEVKDN